AVSLEGTRQTCSAPRRRAREAHEIIEQKSGVLRSRTSLGVKLHTEVGEVRRAYALVGAVVGVDEPGFPLFRQRLVAHSITVVLARDKATTAQQILDWLIDAAMAVRKLIGVSTRRKRQDLVSQAYTENRLAIASQERAHLTNQRRQILWIPRAVADQDSIRLASKCREISVPGCTNDARVPGKERAHDIVLGADIDE